MAVDADTADRKLSIDTESDPDPEATDPADPEESGANPSEAAEIPDSHRVKRSELRIGLILVVALILVLGGLAGWFGYQTLQERKVERERNLFLETGRQAALNLTTIDFNNVDADIKRVLDTSTGTFHDEFQKNSAGFVDIVKRAQAKSVGSVTEAGIDSVNGDTAQILVTATVNTTNAGTPDPEPRLWRMRIIVQKQQDGEEKVSNVGFVP